MPLLWFEVFDDGHQKEYLTLALRNNTYNGILYATCSPSDARFNNYHLIRTNKFFRIALDRLRYTGLSPFLQFIYLLSLLRRKNLSISHCVILSGDQIVYFLPFLALAFPKCAFNILLLRPTPIDLHSLPFTGYIKRTILQFSDKLSNVSRILMHSSSLVETYRLTGVAKATWLCDPPLLDSHLLKNPTHHVFSSRHVFLVFGHISPRKNVLQLMEAMTKVDNCGAKQGLSLHIVGTISDNYLRKINDLALQIHDSNPHITITVFPGFHSAADLARFVSNCDSILAYYSNHSHSSSGILAIAAQANKPILVAGNTHMSYLVHKYKLGFSCDRSNQIPAALSTLLNLRSKDLTDISLRDQFLRLSNQSEFANALLSFY